MMAGMRKAEGLGPDFLNDGQPDVEVTGTLPMSMTTFVSIYAKLGTDGRSATVRRARELRLFAASRS